MGWDCLAYTSHRHVTTDYWKKVDLPWQNDFDNTLLSEWHGRAKAMKTHRGQMSWFYCRNYTSQQADLQMLSPGNQCCWVVYLQFIKIW